MNYIQYLKEGMSNLCLWFCVVFESLNWFYLYIFGGKKSRDKWELYWYCFSISLWGK